MRPQTLYRVFLWGLVAFLVAGLVGSVLEGQWMNAATVAGILILTIVPWRLTRQARIYVPPEFEVLAILFVFASLFLGEIRGYYVRFWWWDLLLHSISGLLLGILGFSLVYVLNRREDIQLFMKPAFVALFAFTFAVAAGALWEIFEFGMDVLFGLNMQKSGLPDTMGDLIVDTAGALVMALVGYAYMRWDRESIVFDWIERFVERNPHLFRSS